jgi:hypothetical protein
MVPGIRHQYPELRIPHPAPRRAGAPGSMNPEHGCWVDIVFHGRRTRSTSSLWPRGDVMGCQERWPVPGVTSSRVGATRATSGDAVYVKRRGLRLGTWVRSGSVSESRMDRRIDRDGRSRFRSRFRFRIGERPHCCGNSESGFSNISEAFTMWIFAGSTFSGKTSICLSSSNTDCGLGVR